MKQSHKTGFTFALLGGTLCAAFAFAYHDSKTVDAEKMDITCTKQDGALVRYEGYRSERYGMGNSAKLGLGGYITLVSEGRDVATFAKDKCDIQYHPETEIPSGRFHRGALKLTP
ncbi:hypothetical protein [Micavibrio aeruginosavorus]|uniref:hypothetical protein n=1 Tax=Micavibrio aeruginosavorus TaxID=349221 RepID=UPI003F4ACEE8